MKRRKAEKQKMPGSTHINKAYLCSDGIVRWVIRHSSRGYYHIYWRNVGNDLWHPGARIKVADFVALAVAEDASPPGPGHSYKYCGVLGHSEERSIPRDPDLSSDTDKDRKSPTRH